MAPILEKNNMSDLHLTTYSCSVQSFNLLTRRKLSSFRAKIGDIDELATNSCLKKDEKNRDDA